MIFKLLDEAEMLGFKVIVLTGGGEPFLRSDIFEIINYGNLPKIIITNGTLLNEDIVYKLSRCELLSYIKISFDGFNAQRYLRGENTVNDILFSIKLLEKFQIPYGINTVLTEHSLYDLEKMYDFISTSKAFSWGVYPLISQGRAMYNNIKEAKIESTAQIISNILLRYFDDNCPFFFEVEYLFIPELLDTDWSETTIVAKPEFHPCEYQINAVTIRLNGDVSQCSRLQESFGNIYNNSLQEILSGEPRITYLKRTLNEITECISCKYLPLCHGGCPGRRQLMGIEKDKADHIACGYMEAFERYILSILPYETQARIKSLILL